MDLLTAWRRSLTARREGKSSRQGKPRGAVKTLVPQECKHHKNGGNHVKCVLELT
jgi:hypothetical protein